MGPQGCNGIGLMPPMPEIAVWWWDGQDYVVWEDNLEDWELPHAKTGVRIIDVDAVVACAHDDEAWAALRKHMLEDQIAHTRKNLASG